MISVLMANLKKYFRQWYLQSSGSIFTTIFILGIFLRVYLINQQIPLDDEWHSIDFVLNNNLSYLFTHFTLVGANSIPMNIYRRILLETVGWSELLLILPALIPSIISLVVFPLVVRQIYNVRITVIFYFLFTISPFIILYARIGRPYSIYMLFGFLALFSFYFWIVKGQKKFALLYVLSGIISIYFHILAVIPVFAPWVCALIFSFFPKLRGYLQKDPITPSPIQLITIGLIIASVISVLMLPAVLQRIPPPWQSEARFTFHTAIGIIELFSGTSSTLLMIISISLTVFGYLLFLRDQPLLGVFCFSIFISYLGVFLILKPNMAHVSIVAARYIIPLFPICILFMALGVAGLYQKMPSALSIPMLSRKIPINIIISGGLLVAFVTTSPLVQIYRSPNNFTNHTAFQESYSTIDYSEPRMSEAFPMKWHLTAKTLSPFYKQLAVNPYANKIIEYPMLVGSNYNPYYYYQHFHKKKVAVGFIRTININKAGSQGCVAGNFLIDFILSKLPDDRSEKIKFSNLINILDLNQLQLSQADYILLHKNIGKEILPDTNLKFYNTSLLMNTLIHFYEKHFGIPVFEDDFIVAFKIR